MSIRPVDFNGMIQRTQDVSTLKQNEDNRPVVEQQTIFSQEMKKVEAESPSGGSCPGKRECRLSL